jgi:hypothetical protein
MPRAARQDATQSAGHAGESVVNPEKMTRVMNMPPAHLHVHNGWDSRIPVL